MVEKLRNMILNRVIKYFRTLNNAWFAVLEIVNCFSVSARTCITAVKYHVYVVCQAGLLFVSQRQTKVSGLKVLIC